MFIDSVKQAGKCSHRSAYMYYLKSVLSEKPFYGQLCNSLNDIKVGNCTEEKSMFGGDPGAFEQLVAKKNYWRIEWK